MRSFFSTHWKAIVALVLLVLLAVITMSPGAAGDDLSARLRQHVGALAPHGHGNAARDGERAARYIAALLASEGYGVRRQGYGAGGAGHIEVSLANVAPGQQPSRVFMIGARYDTTFGQPHAGHNPSGPAAVLELARLLRRVHPGPGTELRFVFLQGGAPGTSSFIAFAGTGESSNVVARALAAFRASPEHSTAGLAAPAYVQGVTLSDRAARGRNGYPALMFSDTTFLRYPYYHTGGDTLDEPDYESLARVVQGLARTIAALAGTTTS